MPITLSGLKAQRVKAPAIEFENGESLNLVYLPNHITPGFLESLKDNTDLMTLANVVTEIVAEWDLLDEKGDALPVSVELAADLGVALLQEIIQTVAGDSRPNVKRGKR